MQTGYARKMVLAAILALTVATGVGAGSAASSEAPQVTIGTHGALGPVMSSEAARRVVSLGYDRRLWARGIRVQDGEAAEHPRLLTSRHSIRRVMGTAPRTPGRAQRLLA